jgi:hypothetical protein
LQRGDSGSNPDRSTYIKSLFTSDHAIGNVQVVEQLSAKPKEELKGYEMFQMAIDMGLKQVRYFLGYASCKRACALGAMNYILTDGKECTHSSRFAFFGMLTPRDVIRKRVADRIYDGTGYRVSVLNNKYGWTFVDFRDFCKEHDI